MKSKTLIMHCSFHVGDIVFHHEDKRPMTIITSTCDKYTENAQFECGWFDGKDFFTKYYQEHELKLLVSPTKKLAEKA